MHATDHFVRARIDHFDGAGVGGLRPLAIAQIGAGLDPGKAERFQDCSRHGNSENI